MKNNELPVALAVILQCAAVGQAGQPRVNAEQLIEWVADWVKRGGQNLGKPTHFEVRDGKY